MYICRFFFQYIIHENHYIVCTSIFITSNVKYPHDEVQCEIKYNFKNEYSNEFDFENCSFKVIDSVKPIFLNITPEEFFM